MTREGAKSAPACEDRNNGSTISARVFNKNHLTCSYVWKSNTSPDSGSFQNLAPLPEKKQPFMPEQLLALCNLCHRRQSEVFTCRFVSFSAILVLFHMGFDGIAGIIKHRFRKPYHWQSRGDVRRFLPNFVLNQDTGHTRDDFFFIFFFNRINKHE